jgi:hypothetical protein
MYVVARSLLICQTQTALIELIPYEKTLTDGKGPIEEKFDISPYAGIGIFITENDDAETPSLGRCYEVSFLERNDLT